MDTNEFLEEYKTERAAILSSEDLSDKGKQKKLAELENDVKDKARSLIKDLRLMAITAGLTASDAARGRRIEGQRAEKSLDYSRLSYEAGRIKSLIGRAKDISEIEDAWKKVKDEGDSYVLQAWKDTAEGVIRERKDLQNTFERAVLLGDLQKTSVNHAGKTAIGDIEKDAVRTLEDIKEQAQAIEDALGAGRGGVIKRVLDGIKATENGVVTEFKEQEVKRSNGELEKESPEEVFFRLEREHEKRQEGIDKAAANFEIHSPDPDGLKV